MADFDYWATTGIVVVYLVASLMPSFIEVNLCSPLILLGVNPVTNIKLIGYKFYNYIYV